MELDIIDRIEEENEMLKQSIDSCQRTWYSTLNLLREAFHAMILIEVALSDYQSAAEEAKSHWVLSSQFKILGSSKKKNGEQ